MSRYVIAGIVLMIYAAVAARIVGRTGEAHREALRLSRESRTPPASKPEPQVVSAATPLSGPEPAPSRVESVPVVANVPPVGVHHEPEPAPPPRVAPKIEKRTPLSPWANTLDLARLKPEDEKKLGLELNKLIMTTNRALNDGNWLQRVEQAAAPILETRARHEIEYQFTVLDSDAVSAFSHPGGYIYVCRGVFDLFGEDEDYAIEFLVAHEVAHVDLKHALSMIAPSNEEVKKQGAETLVQFIAPLVAGYPDKLEFDADSWAYQHMTGQLQRSRYKALKFLRKFKGYAEENKFPNGHADPGPKSNPIENHFRAQPAAWKRLNRLSPDTTPPAVAPLK